MSSLYQLSVRPLTPSDFPDLTAVLDATGLFPPDLLAPMYSDASADAAEPCVWRVVCLDTRVVGFAFSRHETFTEGTWNLLAIAVHPDAQGRGAGRVLLAEIESAVRTHDARLLIIDTDGGDEHAGARAFYNAQGYRHEATIADYWAPGADKLTFWKSLSG
ncbi:MAG: GNAT family N-acetyltransferase [Pseudomonadota bacterium]